MRIALAGRLAAAMPTMFSMRVIASRGLLACSVHIEPSWPVFMACSMSMASGPRTSPQMMRSGPHAQRVLDQIAHGDLALALEIGRAGLQPHDMRLLQLQLGRVLDRDHALAGVDQLRHGVEHRGLAGAGAAGDDDVEPAGGGDLEHAGHRRR